MESIWWQIFDILGTIAFAISGVLVATTRRMDIFGSFVLAAATAVGGGIVRDLLIGRIPPTAFRSGLYFWLIMGSIVGTALLIRYVRFQDKPIFATRSKQLYLLCDAIGLGSFTITGTLLGYSMYPELWILDITLGVITAVGGGVIRDVLAGLIPGVLKTDIYATASIIGAAVLYVFISLPDVSTVEAAMASFLVTVGIRLLTLQFHWNLPHIARRRPGARW